MSPRWPERRHAPRRSADRTHAALMEIRGLLADLVKQMHYQSARFDESADSLHSIAERTIKAIDEAAASERRKVT